MPIAVDVIAIVVVHVMRIVTCDVGGFDASGVSLVNPWD